MKRARHKRVVTVCAECRRSSCWLGVFFCEKAKWATTIEVPVDQLRRERRESPDWWKERTLKKFVGGGGR